MSEYKYTESGLDNVIIAGVSFVKDDASEMVVRVPNINGLHKAIATAIVTRHSMMSGREMRFLRSEMGMTQAELSDMIHREPLTISRWERGENDIEANAETLFRLQAIKKLGLAVDYEVSVMSGWSIPSAVIKPIVINGTDTNNYQPEPLAA
jgi:transcriptional regulator with XRE-family HTH domain